jgi:hypothetical protein
MLARSAWLAVALATAATIGILVVERDAHACGGCFAPPGPSTQVTAHRMAFALSSKRTVLWDQIQYTGDPTSWGWVLPIRGLVEVGVSDDELFARLEYRTQPIVVPPPPPSCPPTKACITRCYRSDAPVPVDAPAPADSASVDVWDDTVVGPYEAVQLSASDGSALRTWLKDHGFVVPTSIEPVIDQYVTEGFGFLALKLVPDAGTSKMVPVRIGYPGGSPSLPLRMVAAGVGANVGIKLFVLGEGRWEAKNFPNAEVTTADLVWDYGAMGSNFGALEAALIAKTPNVWLSETSDDYARNAFTVGIAPGTTKVDSGAVISGISDDEEIDKVFGTRANVTATRMFASLPAAALASDLELQASLGGKIPQSRVAPKSVNFRCNNYYYEYCEGISPPECAPGGPKEAGPLGANDTAAVGGGCACDLAPGSAAPLGALFAFVLGLAGAAARRSRKR